MYSKKWASPASSFWAMLIAMCIIPASLCLTPSALAGPAVTRPWGGFLNPFAVDSPWNSRPVAPGFGTFEIPASTYVPMIGGGAFSTGVFMGRDGDATIVVHGPANATGIWDVDAENVRATIAIPRWPAGVSPASGGDGHADIVDPNTGIIHSFSQLRWQNGQWVAQQYAWTHLAGRGWGDPAHYFQGARATGVPALAGLIRKHEVADGQSMYRHALAMSLTYSALSPKPAYMFPATSADASAAQDNSGAIPEGALLMLPPTYSTAQIANPALRKVAETLKTYGAYVVDRNAGTPFVINVENGAGYDLHARGWDPAVQTELNRIRSALRQVVSTQGWLDGNGNSYAPQKKYNVLSMRGPWSAAHGMAPGLYDTWTQAVTFPAADRRQVQTNYTSSAQNRVSWAAPKPGRLFRLTAAATGDATLRLRIFDAQGAGLFDSGELANGDARDFVWPAADATLALEASSGGGQPSSVRGVLFDVAQ